MPATAPGFHNQQIAFIRFLLTGLVRDERLDDLVVWFYTPLAVPLLGALRTQAVVYDCMDELSAFRNAPPELLGREKELLGRVDVVFTGGPSLYRAKKDRHPNVHCFPSSVDAAHFGKARSGAAEAPDQAGLPRPRLGFFGVIDERFDAPLVDVLAAARPDWQIVLVGPVVKIDSVGPKSITSASAPMRNRLLTSPAGACVRCRSPAMRPRASSDRPRRWNTRHPRPRGAGNHADARRRCLPAGNVGRDRMHAEPGRRPVLRPD